MDNKAAMLDVERVVRGQRSQGRAVQAFHQLANQRFKAARPGISMNRVRTRHQKSHTKQISMSAFLNRCIDVLLTYAPPACNGAQPDTTMAELEHGYVVMTYQPDDVHRTNGQHVFGDVRAAIGEQLKKQLEARYAASKTQGAVAAMNPTAFRETRDIAWQLGRKHNLLLLPSMHLALVTQNMSTHHTFIGAETGPCTWCGAEQGASAAATRSSHFFA